MKKIFAESDQLHLPEYFAPVPRIYAWTVPGSQSGSPGSMPDSMGTREGEGKGPVCDGRRGRRGSIAV